MSHLKSLALDHYSSLIGNQVHLADFVKDLLDTQEKQYQHLLTLDSQQNSSHALQVSIQNAQAQQHELKRKFDELDTSPSTAVLSLKNFVNFIMSNNGALNIDHLHLLIIIISTGI
ncbi:hypothetical protein BDA99DRAFT_531394 [Phascolomyces articulosus]|uniref:Uncharacterized protein n=1 Tax=Phascolomyces articulosus TaxID=60185 RepID=A0AAD5KC87_9FUNG|nr:hypothetical protein BDA99DRAFT_531394 [Phascolomyces articulosus]